MTDPSDIAREMLDMGRRALVGSVAGGVWIAWGLVAARAFAAPVLAALVLGASLLLVGCAYCIVNGYRSLQKKHSFAGQSRVSGFLIVTILEAAGVIGVVLAAQKTQRLDALPAWIGLVVGLHFFGLAKVFGVSIYCLTGVSITLWCVLAWILFRGNPLIISAGLGVGAILWATSSFNLFRVLCKAKSGIGLSRRRQA